MKINFGKTICADTILSYTLTSTGFRNFQIKIQETVCGYSNAAKTTQAALIGTGFINLFRFIKFGLTLKKGLVFANTLLDIVEDYNEIASDVLSLSPCFPAKKI